MAAVPNPERDLLEIEKMRRESDKLLADAIKSYAEAAKANKETAWYPWVTLLASNLLAAVIGVTAAHFWR
jgi:hypothetical protein